jgi:hypothetical protein
MRGWALLASSARTSHKTNGGSAGVMGFHVPDLEDHIMTTTPPNFGDVPWTERDLGLHTITNALQRNSSMLRIGSGCKPMLVPSR